MYRPLADDGIVRRLLAAAAAAPSIHNTQPWRFRIAGHDLVEVHGDPDRMLWVADPRGRALHLSCGAALLNLRLAIRVSGVKPLVWALPDPAGEPAPSSVTVRAVSGIAAQELIKASTDSDLVVVGSRGGGGFARLMLGSVSTQVVSHAACPVVVIPPDR